MENSNNKELSKEETELFKALTSGKYNNFALLRAQYDKKDCAVIVSLNEDSENQILISPVAILTPMNEDILNKLTLEGKPLS